MIVATYSVCRTEKYVGRVAESFWFMSTRPSCCTYLPLMMATALLAADSVEKTRRALVERSPSATAWASSKPGLLGCRSWNKCVLLMPGGRSCAVGGLIDGVAVCLGAVEVAMHFDCNSFVTEDPFIAHPNDNDMPGCCWHVLHGLLLLFACHQMRSAVKYTRYRRCALQWHRNDEYNVMRWDGEGFERQQCASCFERTRSRLTG